MIKLMLVVVSAFLLSSCNETVDNLYKKVMPKPSVVAADDESTKGGAAAADESTKESVIAADGSKFKSSGSGFAGSNINSTSAPISPEQVAVADLKSSGVKFTLYFSFDGFGVDDAATKEIIKHANFMSENPKLKLRLEGHADERGTREYNLALGENRALAVKEVLGLYDLSSRIEVISFGEEKPIAQLHEESSWQKNRRVEFIYE